MNKFLSMQDGSIFEEYSSPGFRCICEETL
jgi:hypothetical protein